METLLNKISGLTEEYGGQWGMNHTKRLLRLISIIGEGLHYNHEAVTIAAYLHDWGGYSKWEKPVSLPGPESILWIKCCVHLKRRPSAIFNYCIFEWSEACVMQVIMYLMQGKSSGHI